MIRNCVSLITKCVPTSGSHLVRSLLDGVNKPSNIWRNLDTLIYLKSVLLHFSSCKYKIYKTRITWCILSMKDSMIYAIMLYMLYIQFIIYQRWCYELKMIYDKFYWFSRLITGLRASTYLAKFLRSWQKLNLVSQSIWIDQHNIHLIFSQPPRGSGRHFRWLAGFYCCLVRHKRTPPPQCVTKGCRDKCTKDLQENIFLLSIQAPVGREL